MLESELILEGPITVYCNLFQNIKMEWLNKKSSKIIRNIRLGRIFDHRNTIDVYFEIDLIWKVLRKGGGSQQFWMFNFICYFSISVSNGHYFQTITFNTLYHHRWRVWADVYNIQNNLWILPLNIRVDSESFPKSN